MYHQRKRRYSLSDQENGESSGSGEHSPDEYNRHKQQHSKRKRSQSADGMEMESQNFISDSNAEVTFNKGEGVSKVMSTLGEGKDTHSKGNKVSINNSKTRLQGDPRQDTNVDYRKLFKFIKDNLYHQFLFFDMDAVEKIISCRCPQYKCGKMGNPTKIPENAPSMFEDKSLDLQMKYPSPDNDESACSCMKPEDFGALQYFQVFRHNRLDSASGRDALSVHNTTIKLFRIIVCCPEDFSEEYRKYQGRHEKARELCKLNEEYNEYCMRVREEIHEQFENCRLPRAIQDLTKDFVCSEPAELICFLESVHEAIEQEQAFIESHKEVLLVGPKQGYSGDHFFYFALNSAIKEACHLNLVEHFQWLHEYYGVEMPSKD